MMSGKTLAIIIFISSFIPLTFYVLNSNIAAGLTVFAIINVISMMVMFKQKILTIFLLLLNVLWVAFTLILFSPYYEITSVTVAIIISLLALPVLMLKFVASKVLVNLNGVLLVNLVLLIGVSLIVASVQPSLILISTLIVVSTTMAVAVLVLWKLLFKKEPNITLNPNSILGSLEKIENLKKIVTPHAPDINIYHNGKNSYIVKTVNTEVNGGAQVETIVEEIINQIQSKPPMKGIIHKSLKIQIWDETYEQNDIEIKVRDRNYPHHKPHNVTLTKTAPKM